MLTRIGSLRFGVVFALIALIGLVPSCKKKESSGGGNIEITPGSASTDHLVFLHLNAKSVLESQIFRELMDAFVNQGEKKTFEEIENEIAKEVGMKITSVESVTVVMPEFSEEDRDPPLILIISANSAIPKKTVLRGRLEPAPDRPNYYTMGRGALAHFPDDKTMVVLHPRFADRYASGYAVNRNGWPLNQELIDAAKGHTLFAVVSPAKLPADLRQERELEKFRPLLDAKSAQLTLDIRGKEFALNLSGKFENPTAATNAKKAIDQFLGEAGREIDKVLQSPKSKEELGIVLPLVKEAQRAVREAKVSTSGNDLTASASYKADFDVGQIVREAVVKVRAAAARTKEQNNFKQVGLALHNYYSAMKQLPIHGVAKNNQPIGTQFGKNGELVFNPKPLLSWRVAILPYIEEGNLYNEFKHDEPWDSEHNKKLISRMPKLFYPVTKDLPAGMTHVQQIVGPTCSMPGLRIENIHDGTSNTIAVVQAAEPVIWTKPDDVMFSEKDYNAPPPKDLKKKFGGYFPNGFIVAMWDGSVRFVDSRFVSDSTLWNLLRPSDGMAIGSDW